MTNHRVGILCCHLLSPNLPITLALPPEALHTVFPLLHCLLKSLHGHNSSRASCSSSYSIHPIALEKLRLTIGRTVLLARVSVSTFPLLQNHRVNRHAAVTLTLGLFLSLSPSPRLSSSLAHQPQFSAEGRVPLRGRGLWQKCLPHSLSTIIPSLLQLNIALPPPALGCCQGTEEHGTTLPILSPHLGITPKILSPGSLLRPATSPRPWTL